MKMCTQVDTMNDIRVQKKKEKQINGFKIHRVIAKIRQGRNNKQV